MILLKRDELVRAKSIPPSSAEVEENDPAWPGSPVHVAVQGSISPPAENFKIAGTDHVILFLPVNSLTY